MTEIPMSRRELARLQTLIDRAGGTFSVDDAGHLNELGSPQGPQHMQPTSTSPLDQLAN